MKKKIFIVDDDKTLLKLFKIALSRKASYTIITEISGIAALRKLKKNIPDILILDIILPDISGIEICKQLRKIDEFETTKIIAYTSLYSKEDIKRILKAGFDEYYPKTIHIKEIVKIIENLIE
ncbi:MAG: response regulator [Promethearchaeota archaeon]